MMYGCAPVCARAAFIAAMAAATVDTSKNPHNQGEIIMQGGAFQINLKTDEGSASVFNLGVSGQR